MASYSAVNLDESRPLLTGHGRLPHENWDVAHGIQVFWMQPTKVH
jgi:hypothetical protein